MSDKTHEQEKENLIAEAMNLIGSSDYQGLKKIFSNEDSSTYFSDKINNFLTYAVDVFYSKYYQDFKIGSKKEKKEYKKAANIIALLIANGANFRTKVISFLDENKNRRIFIKRPFLTLLKTNEDVLINFALDNTSEKIKTKKNDIKKAVKKINSDELKSRLVKYFNLNVLKARIVKNKPKEKKVNKEKQRQP